MLVSLARVRGRRIVVFSAVFSAKKEKEKEWTGELHMF